MDDVKPDVKQEPDDLLEAESALENMENKTESVSNTVKNSYRKLEETIKKRKLKRQSKYRYINTKLRKHRGYITKKISIGIEEAMSMLEEEKRSSVFLLAKHKCISCVAIVDNEQELLDHNRKYHVSAGRFVCHVCQSRCLTPDALSSHVSSHGVCRQCRACAWRGVSSGVMREHVEKHHNMAQCIACGILFKNTRTFYRHYHAIHGVFVCDVCGKRYKMREMIVKHLRHHFGFECPFCKKRLMTYSSYHRHLGAWHKDPYPDQAYCVSCDRRFKSNSMYKLHLKNSLAHAQERSESRCPDCGKKYSRKKSMMLHYNLVHLKKTDYYCALCEKYYLSHSRLRRHHKYFHEKLPKPKNKQCEYCEKRFSTNAILANHIRTHTGERPFVCSHCSAAFTQKQSLTGHVRKMHK